jgi:tRNA pseudouridine38-40 synthase
MPRYRLTIEYDGTGYVGWQRQENGPSIQQALEQAFLAFCGEETTLSAAGRTDSGVHALGQVAHVDLARDWPAATVRNAVNQHLRPQPIALVDVAAVPDAFHARFDAVERLYHYRIVTRSAPLALDQGRAWHLPRGLNAEAMHDAAQVLVGHHDFTTFRDTQCQAKSPVKTLDELSVRRDGDAVTVTARARSFLHRQVRSMVGSLSYVGDGKWTAGDLRAALEARDRAACGVIAPACGLYLVAVRYP